MSVPPSPVVRLAQRYVLRERIAVGGMGEVHLATDERLSRPVAVKVLGPRFADDAEAVERFRREALTAARLDHAAVAQVYDYGVETGGDDGGRGTHFLVMEHVPGPDLARVLHDKGRLGVAEAVDVTAQVCAALAAAHDAGVVHRDVKPGNVMLTAEGRVKVTDFGIARVRGLAPLTDAGAVLGTAAYLSPEQVRGEAVTPASDLYALGILLHRMLTGVVPFEGDTPVVVALRHLEESVPPPSERLPGLSPALDDVVLRATAKDPADRFVDAREMARAVRRAGAAAAGSAAATEQPAGTGPEAAAVARPIAPPGGPAAPPTPHAGRHAGRHRGPRRAPRALGALRAVRAPRRAALFTVGAVVAAVAALVVALVISPGATRPVASALPATNTPPVTAATPEPSSTGETPGAPTGEPTNEPTDAPTQHAEPLDPSPTASPADPGAPVPVPVPRELVGSSVDGVGQVLRDLGLRERRVGVRSSAPRGRVLSLYPRAGSTVPPGSTVVTVTSRGADDGQDGGGGWRVPAWVVGAPGAVLARGLEGRGITAITSLVASGRPRDTVLATYPGPGAAVRAGQMVLLTSSGHRTAAGSTGP